MKTENVSKEVRSIRIDLFSSCEKAILNAQYELEKVGASEGLTKASMLLSEARQLVSNYLWENKAGGDEAKDESQDKVQSSRQLFLLEYHLSRRDDEGWGNLALINAHDFNEAKEILIKAKTYNDNPGLANGWPTPLQPDHIKCLNI